MSRDQAEARLERELWTHLSAYLAAVIALAILNFSINAENPWVLWVATAWGVFVSLHASVLSDPPSRSWLVERSLHRSNRRWLRSRQPESTTPKEAV